MPSERGVGRLCSLRNLNPPVLSYDENGSKKGGKVVIAKFEGNPSIDHSEMIIV